MKTCKRIARVIEGHRGGNCVIGKSIREISTAFMVECCSMKVFIAAHPGLGDHVLCNGIYRSYANSFEKVWIGVSKSNITNVKSMLHDLNNVELVTFGPPVVHFAAQSFFIKRIKKRDDIRVLGLGYYGDKFMENCRYDESFYHQAEVKFDTRWSGFDFPREASKQEYVFSQLVGDKKKKYIFLHEDVGRKMQISRKYLGQSLDIVRPSLDPGEFSIFDYELVLKRAEEIHCIESSFAALTESLEVPGAKFAHRYARSEAKNDWRLEFTYRSNWEILL
jgi:hypothetical protein